MDAKLMVATDRGDVKKLKDVLNKEDAVAMVVVTATSKKPFEEDQPPAGNIINPLLLALACVGSWEALNVLLEGEDARMAPSQEFHGLVARGTSSTEGMISRDVEEGVGHHPSSLAAGALLEGVTPEGDTALHAVAGNGDGQNFLECATNIYDRNRGLLFVKNHRGDTPLHCAARAGNSKMVSHLIDLAAREGVHTKLSLLRMENNCHETALHQAVRFEDGRILVPKEIGARLAGADLAGEERNKDDAGGAPEEKNIVKLLMGADPKLANYPAEGISPLYLAILLGKSSIALTLYDQSGGNLSYSGADGQNALHVAVLRDPVMRLLLLHWHKGLIAQVDKDGSTPLHFASSYFWAGSYLHPELLPRFPWCRFVWTHRRSTWTPNILFKAYPAALYYADKDGSFPIHVAASGGAKDTIRVFHAESPNSVGLRNAKGRTLLHVAVEKGKLDIVLHVCRISSFAWILNMQDDDGNTALHLAIKARRLRMFSALLGNPEVNFNITNNHGETPRDLSRSTLPRGMLYGLNSENIILGAVSSVGGNHGSLRWDKIEETYNWRVKPEEEEKESERLRNAAQALMVASVLITTVAFTASFALPGGYKADDHTNGGTPTHAGSYVFDAFMMATTLAFICSSMATIGFVFAATPMVSLFTRKVNFNIRVFFMWSSVTCLSIAFALGVYMVLAPVARSTAVAVCVITPAVLLSASMEFIIKLVILARPLCIRKGLFRGMLRLLGMHLFMVIIGFWPFIVTFGWAALARIYRHR